MAALHEKDEFNKVFIEAFTFFCHTHFFEKYVRIKIEDHKILVQKARLHKRLSRQRISSQ